MRPHPALLLILVAACPGSGTNEVKVPARPPDAGVRPSGLIACGADGGYVVQATARLSVEVMAPARKLDSPYSICFGRAGEAKCHHVSDRGWQIDVKEGDAVFLKIAGGAPELFVRLCPSSDASPLAEWSVEKDIFHHTATRPPPDVGIYVEPAP